jgi:hypothetical protein
VDVEREPLADLRQAGVVRRRFPERDAEEGPQGEAVAAPPGDGPLGVEALEVPDEEHAEGDARRDRLPADAVGVVLPAEAPDVAVEAGVGEQAVEPIVEGVADGPCS